MEKFLKLIRPWRGQFSGNASSETDDSSLGKSTYSTTRNRLANWDITSLESLIPKGTVPERIAACVNAKPIFPPKNLSTKKYMMQEMINWCPLGAYVNTRMHKNGLKRYDGNQNHNDEIDEESHGWWSGNDEGMYTRIDILKSVKIFD